MTEKLVTIEGDESSDGHTERFEFRGPTQLRQVDNEAGGQNLRAEFAQQLDGRFGRAARRDEVIYQDDPLAARDGILVHLHFVQAVLERVRDPHGGVGKLALLAYRYE